jgi:hypothetical protein
MANTLAARRDRRGHIVCVLLALLCARPASAAPGQYKAIRFDVAAAAARGDLDVTERMTFQFQTGTYTFVWRDIPAERTDGIEVLGAAIDDVALTAGTGPGHYSVSGRTRIRVEWRFAETGPSTHRFELHYLARGVVYRDGGRDVVRWRALPAEHRYRIDASRIRFEPGAAEVLPLDARHVASATAHEAADAVTVEAFGIAPNGSVTAELRYPAGGLIDTDPAWRSREAAARRFAPRWAIGGAAAFGAALLIVLVALRAYPAPATFPSEAPATEPPQALPAALASVLAAKGRASGYRPLGTLLDLADRGVLVVKETPRRIVGRTCRWRTRVRVSPAPAASSPAPSTRTCWRTAGSIQIGRRHAFGCAPSDSRCCLPACSAVSLRHRSSRPTRPGRFSCPWVRSSRQSSAWSSARR